MNQDAFRNAMMRAWGGIAPSNNLVSGLRRIQGSPSNQQAWVSNQQPSMNTAMQDRIRAAIPIGNGAGRAGNLSPFSRWMSSRGGMM